MTFSSYPEYRNSEVDWLGEIPAAWDVAKFRHVFRESGEKIDDEVIGPMLSVSGYRGIEIKDYEDENQRRSDEDLIGYRVVRPGQLVVNTMWLNYAGLGVSEHEGHVSPAYRSYWIEADVDRRYIHHLMRSSTYVQGYTQLLTGIRPNSLQMSRDNLMGFPVLLPPRQDQQAIAAFLDRETAKIDALVAEQERLIALLKEKRQAVVSQAVTKGLDPGAPMKNSGIEWLGEIPAHWEVRRIKHLSTRISKGTTPTTVGGDFTSSGIRFLKAENIYDGAVLSEPQFFIDEETHQALSRSELAEHDVLVVIAGATTGKSAVLSADLLPANTNQAVSFVRCAALQHAQLVHNWLSTSIVQTQILLTSVQSAQPNLSMEDLGNLPIAVPTSSECASLSSFVSEIDESYGRLIGEATGAMRLLRERRAALISAAVTGKIDVRGLVEQHETEAA
ncbi:hypothetical protein EH30_14480 [Erythrobacter sp. JL475]|nr:hypothetical protein EH30_14480 [Erythrobacter sp. JL475]